MSILSLAVGLLLALASPMSAQPHTARVTASHDVAAPMPFALPSLKLEGLVRASTGNRLYVVALDLGEESIDSDVARFVLLDEDGKTYEPIGAGGGPDLIVPLDRIPIGTEVGEILPSDAIVSMKRRSATSVALEVPPAGTIAFLYQLPVAASPRALRLPDGRELAVRR
jgi:hypothetical protein